MPRAWPTLLCPISTRCVVNIMKCTWKTNETLKNYFLRSCPLHFHVWLLFYFYFIFNHTEWLLNIVILPTRHGRQLEARVIKVITIHRLWRACIRIKDCETIVGSIKEILFFAFYFHRFPRYVIERFEKFETIVSVSGNLVGRLLRAILFISNLSGFVFLSQSLEIASHMLVLFLNSEPLWSCCIGTKCF